MPKTKKKKQKKLRPKERLVRVDGRALKSDVEALKDANINISKVIRDAIAKAATMV